MRTKQIIFFPKEREEISNFPPSSVIRASSFLVFPSLKAEESKIGSRRKMQIKLKCNCGEAKCLEWAVVELQGVVEPQSTFQDCLQNLEIGILCRPSAQVLSFNFLIYPSFNSSINFFLPSI